MLQKNWMELIKPSKMDVNVLENDGKKVPKWVKDMLASGRESFYEAKDGCLTYYHVLSNSVKTESCGEKSINLNLHKTSGHVVKRNWSASLIDLGDGVQERRILEQNGRPLSRRLICQLFSQINFQEHCYVR